jgi:leader peptidase (prepilin peptidase)/N-methyltransferase
MLSAALAAPWPGSPFAAILGLLGFAALGSLLAAAGTRLAAAIDGRETYRGRSFWTGRSICPACGTVLKASDLVPVLSWIWLRARCRTCGAPIAADYAAIELGSILAFAAALATQPTALRVLAVGLLGAVLACLAVVDLRHQLLPDWLTLPLLPLGLSVDWASGPGPWPTPLDGALGALLGGGLIAAVRAVHRRLRGIEGIGLGDVKLMAVAGAWAGWQGIGSVLLIAALGTLAGAALLRLVRDGTGLGARIPFGPGLAAGCFATVLFGPLSLAV